VEAVSKTISASEKYMDLIRLFPLRPIRNDEMLDRASNIYSELVLKGNHRKSDETDYLTILGKLIREYEDEHLKPLAKRMTPNRALASLMEDNHLSQSELARKIHTTQSVISEFLAGKRGISKALITSLADYFKVSPELFLS
jgi:HTH-type transcriptional regulator/antitoxin HigA